MAVFFVLFFILLIFFIGRFRGGGNAGADAVESGAIIPARPIRCATDRRVIAVCNALREIAAGDRMRRNCSRS